MSGCLPTDVAYTFASFVNHIYQTMELMLNQMWWTIMRW